MLKDDRLDQLEAAHARTQARTQVQQRPLTGARYHPPESFEFEPVAIPAASPLLGGSLTPEPDYRAVQRRSDRVQNKSHKHERVTRRLGK